MTRPKLGIIGVGAFGSLAIRFLAPYVDLYLYDLTKDLKDLAHAYAATITDLKGAAACDLVLLAVPVQTLEAVLHAIAPLVRPGALIMDVASVKSVPIALMKRILPPSVDILGTHPLFGPQSGKSGIAGLNIALCHVSGRRTNLIHRFLKTKLGLNVFRCSPEVHDRQMAYVQGLTHVIAKVILSLELPPFQLTTKTFEHVQAMVEMVRYDSDDLFRAIERENPFTREAKEAFFAAARRLEEKLS